MKCLSCGAKDDEPKELTAEQTKKNIGSMPRSEYIRFLEHRGVFVPKRMPAWELDTNAYAELLPINLHLDCEATECFCENGRDYSEETGSWEIVKCLTCGGRGMHMGCFETEDVSFICKGTDSIVFACF